MRLCLNPVTPYTGHVKPEIHIWWGVSILTGFGLTLSWIGEQPYIEMLVLNFSNNPDIYGHVGHKPEQHLIVWLFSNPGDKIIVHIEIL